MAAIWHMGTRKRMCVECRDVPAWCELWLGGRNTYVCRECADELQEMLQMWIQRKVDSDLRAEAVTLRDTIVRMSRILMNQVDAIDKQKEQISDLRREIDNMARRTQRADES